ncbi:Hypothetical protein ING2D1G_1481 [Peptoniphilus sp. ING2-D1G]|nr:Hypothetical protein ING2D1G_1481 [Peptoniphilus sp. ING2-D1G]
MKKILNLMAVLVLSAILFTGCSSTGSAAEQGETSPAQTEDVKVGSILMSVNPEIMINYNQEGKVIDLESVNEDAKKILEKYTDFQGKSVDKVLEELLKEIHAQGFFTEKIAGKDKNIILKLEKGSVKPSDDFVEKITQSVQNSIKTLGMQSEPVSLGDDDFDGQGKITEATAKKLAGKQLDIDEKQISSIKTATDDDFEIEIDKNGNKYKVDLNRKSGKILPAQGFNDDLYDDLDDDYDDLDDDNYENLGTFQYKDNDNDDNDYYDDNDDDYYDDNDNNDYYDDNDNNDYYDDNDDNDYYDDNNDNDYDDNNNDYDDNDDDNNNND